MDMIKEVINRIKAELSSVSSTDGLCYYASNNVCFDLEKMNIRASMFNVREMAFVDYDHYFVLVRLDGCYLVDLTYLQFCKKENHELRFFDDFPATILESSERGSVILNSLLTDGYCLIEDNDLSLYLKSFNPGFDCFFTIDDIFPSKIR